MGDSHYCLFGFLAAGAVLLGGLAWLPELSSQVHLHTGLPVEAGRVVTSSLLFAVSGLIAAYGPHLMDPASRRDPYWTPKSEEDIESAA